jgi:hypothetical protein
VGVHWQNKACKGPRPPGAGQKCSRMQPLMPQPRALVLHLAQHPAPTGCLNCGEENTRKATGPLFF